MSETFIVSKGTDLWPYLGRKVRAVSPGGYEAVGVVCLTPDAEWADAARGFAMAVDDDPREDLAFLVGDVVRVLE